MSGRGPGGADHRDSIYAGADLGVWCVVNARFSTAADRYAARQG